MENRVILRFSKLLHNFLLWRYIAITSLLLQLISILLTSIGLKVGQPILYWQKYIGYIWCFRFLTFFVLLLSVWLSSEKNLRSKSSLGAIFGIIFGLCYLQYFLLFASSFVTHIGTVKLLGKTYQFVWMSKYDDRATYYLGECESNIFACDFSPIYYLNMTGKIPKPTIKLVSDNQEVEFRLDNVPVCFFDSIKLDCQDSDYGYYAK